MVWLRREQAEPPCCSFWERGGGAKLPSLLDAMRNSSAESSIMAHRGVEPMKATPA
jgi:hypothetical protein